MKLLLVDDEQLQLLRLENEVKAVMGKDVTIYAYLNPLEALKDIKDEIIDIAFLDVEMPGMNGISLAKELKKINPSINIIFVTAYDQYAIDAYSIHASGYLTKPVSANKIKEEIEELRKPIETRAKNKIQVKCFGNFEIFHNGKPLSFKRAKSKELFAYLVDKEGALVNNHELSSILWDEYRPSYLRNLIADIQSALKMVDAEDVLIKGHEGLHIDVNKIDCDAYEFKKNNPDAIRMYRGEYMVQYSWAMFVI